MKKKTILRIVLAVLAAALLGGCLYLNSLLPIITGYAAKNLASDVFVSGREPADVEDEGPFTCPDARFLVVDDTPINLVVARGMLSNTEAQVDTAESGARSLLLTKNSASTPSSMAFSLTLQTTACRSAAPTAVLVGPTRRPSENSTDASPGMPQLSSTRSAASKRRSPRGERLETEDEC